jgi:alkylation response protein AidB-like acyl-CoA dehydrogenase
MDFRDSPEEAAFREKAAAWLDEALADVPDQEGLGQDEREHWSRVWQARLSEGGWAGMTWPVEVGGGGYDVVYQAIFNEEAARRNAPYALNGVGTMLAGPTILAHGSDEQKARFLPPTLRSELYWCQGFSEPGAGSDLASLRTAARKVDGGWLISGEKVWTSNAHNAERCLLLARTDPDATKHDGITYFLAEMKDIEVRPLVMINNDAEFNQMYLEDVFVADEDVLGEVGGGWPIALTTLAFERGGMALSLWVWARQAVDRLVAVAEAASLAGDEGVIEQIGMLSAEAEAVRIGSIRAMSDMQAGVRPGAETSALKLLWASTVQQASRLGVQLAGASGVLVDGVHANELLHRYLRARGHTIEGGTDEVQKSILAERVLGLPRSR